jgi:hypothetical protein
MLRAVKARIVRLTLTVLKPEQLIAGKEASAAGHGPAAATDYRVRSS